MQKLLISTLVLLLVFVSCGGGNSASDLAADNSSGGSLNIDTSVITESKDDAVAVTRQSETETPVFDGELELIIADIKVDISLIIKNIPERDLQEKLLEEIKIQFDRNVADNSKTITGFKIVAAQGKTPYYCSVRYEFKTVDKDGTLSPTQHGVARVEKP